ncbi:lipoprotein YedD [Pantoea sp. FN060301]|uniref:lipoprotein YedD n=1 Tax=Pantoea sp. FN060301 TaxID=3420380 RepID=UPI003D179EA2
MQKWIVMTAAAIALSGCAQVPNYQSAVKTPPPAQLVGNWQTLGPQGGLVSPEATASLIITAKGDTLDCRQWQRVIAKPGKVTRLNERWINVNNQARVMPLEIEGTTLHYDDLILQKVRQPTQECQQALHAQNKEPVTEEQPAEKSDESYPGQESEKPMF